MGNLGCNLAPKAKDDKTSKLYKELCDKLPSRPIANYIYAQYLHSGIPERMDKEGYKRDKTQDQHKFKDVMEFLKLNELVNTIIPSGINKVQKEFGIIDEYGTPIKITDAEEALTIVNRINEKYNTLISVVNKVGDTYMISISPKTTANHLLRDNAPKALKAWDIFHSAFENTGVSLSNLGEVSTSVNAFDVSSMLRWLNSFKYTPVNAFSRKDILTLLKLNDITKDGLEKISRVERLKQAFGSLEEAATAIYDAINGNLDSLPHSKRLIQAMIDSGLKELAKFPVLNTKSLENLTEEVQEVFNNSISKEDLEIQDLIQKLGFLSTSKDIRQVSDSLLSLSDAAENAVFALQRLLTNLETEKADNTERIEEIKKAIANVSSEIAVKRYYLGLLNFLKHTGDHLDYMNDLLSEALKIPPGPERMVAMSKALLEVQRTQKGFEELLKRLTDIDSIIIDESIKEEHKTRIKEEAKRQLENLQKYSKDIIDTYREQNMIDICTEWLGQTMSNGMAVANIVSNTCFNYNFFDYIYASSRMTNPILATMGSIIRDAQDRRTQKLAEISRRVRRLENALRKSSSNSRFMYEEDNIHIISDRDYKKYAAALSKYKKHLRDSRIYGTQFDLEVNNWIVANTEEVVVDTKSGRTERLPIKDLYGKEFPNLTEAQMEYYTEMMQLKAELNTLLPEYAQEQHLAPQIRREFIDAMFDSKTSFLGKLRAILTKLKESFTFTENEEDYGRSGFVDGKDVVLGKGNLDGTIKQQIPIYYVSKLKDSQELYKNFSSAMVHLAATALNFEAMNSIKDKVLFMADFMEHSTVTAKEGTKIPIERIRTATGEYLYKQLHTGLGNGSNVNNLIRGILDTNLYGEYKKVSNPVKQKILEKLLTYTSSNALSVNVKGALNNYLVGVYQMFKESIAGEFYNLPEFLLANAFVLGDYTLKIPVKIWDFFTNNKNNFDAVLSQEFDPMMENYMELGHEKFDRNLLKKLVDQNYMFVMYGVGEVLLHKINMYSMLLHEKVLVNGKPKRLLFALKSINKNGVNELSVEEGTQYRDKKDGQLKDADKEYFLKITKRLRGINQSTHGAMAREDKGFIHQYIAGRYLMNLRQWAVEHYSVRYRGAYYDSNFDEEREGAYTTLFNLTRKMATDLWRLQIAAAFNWDHMTDHQKANVRRALTEVLMLIPLNLLKKALGDEDDHKGEYWYRMCIYLTYRMIMEVNGSNPIGFIQESLKLINSPVAGINTLKSIIYPIVSFPDFFEEKEKVVKDSFGDKHKIQVNKGWDNVKKYVLPYYKQISDLIDFDTNSDSFTIFKSNNPMR